MLISQNITKSAAEQVVADIVPLKKMGCEEMQLHVGPKVVQMWVKVIEKTCHGV